MQPPREERKQQNLIFFSLVEIAGDAPKQPLQPVPTRQYLSIEGDVEIFFFKNIALDSLYCDLHCK